MAKKEQENIRLRKTGCVDGTLIRTSKGYFLTLGNPFEETECWVTKDGEEIARGEEKVRFAVDNPRAKYVLRANGEKLPLILTYLKFRDVIPHKDIEVQTEEPLEESAD